MKDRGVTVHSVASMLIRLSSFLTFRQFVTVALAYMERSAIMRLTKIRCLVSVCYAVLLLSFVPVFAQTKPPANDITVYKTPT